MTDHIAAAKAALVTAREVYDACIPSVESAVQLAQTHALIAIAEALTASTRGMVAPSAPGGTAPKRELLPGEAEIMAMPQPKGLRCPACRHDTAVHRMHGCDVGECECTAPHGRILPGDPQPGV